MKNETEKETEAYLYVDGEFKDSKVLNSPSVNNGRIYFKDIEVDKGVHEVSVRWLWLQDPGIHMEYEKKKKVAVKGNKEAVFFVATKGMEVVEKPSTNKTAGKANETTKNNTSQVTPPHQNNTGKDSAVALEVGPRDPGKIDILYIYLIMLLIAIYFAFRR